MAYDMAHARCSWPLSDNDDGQAGEAAPPPPFPSSGERAAGSIHWKPAARPLRYSERPIPLGTRLFGLGGTVLVCLAIVGAALLKWTTSAPPVMPATLSVFDVTLREAPPVPDTEIPPEPEQVQKQQRSQEKAVEIPPPLVQVPTTISINPPVVVPLADPSPPAERATAPDASPQPPRSTHSDAKPTWEGQVLAALNRAKRYPREASFRRQQGVPWIRFVMDREGRVRSVRLERPSGVDSLDREALALPMRAQPLPRPPESVSGDRVELVVPVEFFM